DAELGHLLGEVASAPVTVVGVGGAGPQPFPDGFGALIAPGEALAALGFLFESSYAPRRAPSDSWLFKAIAGGATLPEVVGWDDDRLVGRVLGEAAVVLGRVLEASFAAVVRHLPGVPQPEMGHGDWLAGVEGLLSDRPGLHLTGWGYRGVGVAHLATDAVRVAEAISRRDG
ncbi:MAG: protoporphyrinogen oxidase, partial [Actinobacteria bacterium]|nr:protoporphyrinogen oxidase [Actinomycetota bacterium]